LAVALLLSHEVHNIAQFLPGSQDISVWGSDWLVLNVGASKSLVSMTRFLFWCGGMLMLLGYRVRFGIALVLLSSFYLFSLIQYHSFPVHIHHLWWFSVLLWFSPCDAVLSVGRGRIPQSQPIAELYTIYIGIVFGAIFFFPGWHKCWSADWISGETLMHTVHWKRVQYWDQNIWSVNLPNWSYVLMSWMVVCFELVSIVVLSFRKYGVFLVCALCFHFGVWLLTGIQFSNLWILYLSFLPLLRGNHPRKPFADIFFQRSRHHLVPIVLCFGILCAGCINLQRGFPWVAYPTFTQSIDRFLPLLVIQVTDVKGDILQIPYQEVIEANNQSWGENWRLAGFGNPVSAQKLEDHWTQISKKNPRYARGNPQEVSFWRGHIDTARPSSEPIVKHCIHTLKLSE